MNYYATCPRCLHRELSDGYDASDCLDCLNNDDVVSLMVVDEAPRVFIINGQNARTLVDDATIEARFDPLAVVRLTDKNGKPVWSVTHIPTGIGVFILDGERNRARVIRFCKELSRVIVRRDLEPWFDCDPQRIVEDTPRDVLDWIGANRDESATRYVPLRDAHARAERHRERVAYEAWVASSSIRSACMRNDYTGICRACGNEQSGVEPDAQRYLCEMCGERQVYGAEQLIAMGLDQDGE